MGELTDELTLDARLRELNEAEECVCSVMQMAADTCEELQKLPFVDPTKLQHTSDEVLLNLQKLRRIFVNNLLAVQPIDIQKKGSDGTVDADLINDALKLFE